MRFYLLISFAIGCGLDPQFGKDTGMDGGPPNLSGDADLADGDADLDADADGVLPGPGGDADGTVAGRRRGRGPGPVADLRDRPAPHRHHPGRADHRQPLGGALGGRGAPALFM